MLKIGTGLDPTQRAWMIDFLKEYQEIFAWSYADMPGLDPSIVKHFLPFDTENFPLKRQHLQRQRADLLLRIKEEVVKQINAGFLEVCNYSEWVANIMPVEKKDGRVRVCVDYRDLNKASPKDNFPLPHIDVLVDNTARHNQFSFMDGFSGYNQIQMAEEDKIKTTFITMWGTFCYKVMPFGLKNAGATYQRAMVMLFHDMIAKSKEGEDHLVNLRRLFERFVVSERGIEVDPDKVKAIRELPLLSTVRKVRSFLGRLNYIANLSDKYQPLFRLLRKNAAIEWDNECQKAFDYIKIYLVQLPVLVPPTLCRPLILYLTIRRQSLGPSSMRNIIKWRCQLTEYDIQYVPRTLVKGLAIADHLVEFLIEDDTPINSKFPDEGILQVDGEEDKPAWKMYFDGAVNSTGFGIGAVLISLDRHYYTIAAKAAIDFKVKELEVFGDSMLTIFQTLGQWKTKDVKLVPYHEYLEELAENFEKILFTYTPHIKNQFTDALATLASMMSITKENLIEPLEIEIAKGPAYCDTIEATDEQPCALLLERRDSLPPFLRRHTTLADCAKDVRHCHLCQVYANHIKAPHNELRPMAASWPFSMWGIDVIGPINPKVSNGHMFILVAIDYFTKWIKAITLASVTANAVARFLKCDIIARYEVPETIITNNAKNLNNKMIDEL
ncbi:hypothetical protein CRG98_001918, partial [Punica granatum]